MDTRPLIEDAELLAAIAECRGAIAQPEHAISDIIDDQGNQYVDLVMEGGGMLGIALVGYTWALEQMGIRFLGIGGTSAGSINALLLAALADPGEVKSPRLLTEMAALDFYRFVDGDGTPKGEKRTRALIELALDGKPTGLWKGLRLAQRFWSVRKHLFTRYGLNRGDAFVDWLTDLLLSAGIGTLADLEARMQRLPPLHHRDPATMAAGWQATPGHLVIIGSDVTTETRVEFPAMAGLYWREPKAQNPALFARASMSIPYFFETMRVEDLPSHDMAKAMWAKVGVDLAEENDGKVPAHILFVDGGMTSNFPIDAFHKISKVPACPTFGVKLQYDDRYKPPRKLPLVGNGGLKPLSTLAGAMFNSARHTLDYEFIRRNPDYKHLVHFIPCTYRDPASGQVEGYNWLDFNMPEWQRAGLFKQGAQQAIAFIKGFSGPVDAKGKAPAAGTAPAFSSKWAFYKNLRARIRDQQLDIH